MRCHPGLANTTNTNDCLSSGRVGSQDVFKSQRIRLTVPAFRHRDLQRTSHRFHGPHTGNVKFAGRLVAIEQHRLIKAIFDCSAGLQLMIFSNAPFDQ